MAGLKRPKQRERVWVGAPEADKADSWLTFMAKIRICDSILSIIEVLKGAFVYGE